MKVKARRCRRRNNSALQRRRQKNGNERKLLELKENAAGAAVNSPNHGGNSSLYEEKAAAVAAAILEANRAIDKRNQENNANDEMAYPVQAAPASEDDDSGTENDRNDGAITDDEDSEGEKESYQVEVARTMRDIVHTRDMLFSLTRRVDQLLEFCKILQTKQNQQQELNELLQNQQENQPPYEGAGNSSQ